MRITHAGNVTSQFRLRRAARAVSGLALVTVLASALTMNPLMAQSDLLDVSIVEGPDGPLLRATNVGSKPITAYEVRITTALPGTDIRVHYVKADGYLVADERPLLGIAASRDSSAGVNRAVPLSALTAVVTAVIFDDLSTAGDAARAEEILRLRAQDRDEMLRWRIEWSRVLMRQTGSQGSTPMNKEGARQIALEELASQVTPDALVDAAEQLEKALNDAEATRVTAGLANSLTRLKQMPVEERASRLRVLMRILDQQYANAVSHSRRSQ